MKLEPQLFEGMRDDIWTVVQDIERRTTGKNDDRGNGSGLYYKLKYRMGLLLASAASSNQSSKMEPEM